MTIKGYKHRGKRGDFWSKVESSAGPDACWPWIGSKGDQGYGHVRVNKRLMKAHRRAWELTHGPIPKEVVICHRCDNPPCCNPAHLLAAPQQENIKDMIAKGRAYCQNPLWGHSQHQRAQGEQNGNAKLTVTAVSAIRQKWSDGGYTKKSLAKEYGVTDVLIGKIVRREIWREMLKGGIYDNV